MSAIREMMDKMNFKGKVEERLGVAIRPGHYVEEQVFAMWEEGDTVETAVDLLSQSVPDMIVDNASDRITDQYTVPDGWTGTRLGWSRSSEDWTVWSLDHQAELCDIRTYDEYEDAYSDWKGRTNRLIGTVRGAIALVT